MTRPAFLAIGDMHLDPLIWRKYRQINGDSFYGFAGCAQLAVDNHLPLVLVGDVFDVVDPEPSVIRFFRQQMDRLEAEGVRVYVLQGNHDRRPVPWPVAVHDWPVYIGQGQPVTIGGLVCRAFDYDTRDNIQRKLIDLSAETLPQVLFLHQAVKQALRFDGQWNCDLEWVPDGIPLTVMGDIHIEWHQQFRPGQHAYYTGATHARDIGQRGPKSCLQVNDDLSVERLSIDSRPIEQLVVASPQSVGDATAWLDGAIAQQPRLIPALFVKHTIERSIDVAQLGAAYMGRAFILGDLVDADEAQASTELLVDAALLSPEQLLRTLVDPMREPQAFQLASELAWSSDAVLDVIRNRRENFSV